MRTSKQVQVLGFDELRAAIRALPLELQTKAVRSGLRAGAKVMAEKIRARTPARKGQRLRNAIVPQTRVVKGKSRELPDNWVGEVYVKRERKGKVNPRRYAHLVEFGTKPHKLGKPKVSKPREKSAKGKVLRGTRPSGMPGMHPGTRPQRMFQDGFDEAKQASLEQTLTTIKRKVDAAVKQAKSSAKGKRT